MRKILLVEDDYLDVENVKRLLKKNNIQHELHVVHNGLDALTYLTSDAEHLLPDLIILDISMPKMNGIEFLRIIRNYFSLKSIKVYIMTTSSEHYDRTVMENLGINGYLVKPLTANHAFFKEGFMAEQIG